MLPIAIIAAGSIASLALIMAALRKTRQAIATLDSTDQLAEAHADQIVQDAEAFAKAHTVTR